MLLDYTFEASPVERVITDFVKHLQNITDKGGVTLFGDERCGRGNSQVIYTPSAEATPFCHVWLDRAAWKIKSMPPYPMAWVADLTIVVGAFNNDPGYAEEFTAQMNDMCFWVANSLSDPSVPLDADNNPGLAFDNNWRGFEIGDVSMLDEQIVRDRYGRFYQLSEGFALRGMTLRFNTMGEIR